MYTQTGDMYTQIRKEAFTHGWKRHVYTDRRYVHVVRQETGVNTDRQAGDMYTQTGEEKGIHRGKGGDMWQGRRHVHTETGGKTGTHRDRRGRDVALRPTVVMARGHGMPSAPRSQMRQRLKSPWSCWRGHSWLAPRLRHSSAAGWQTAAV